MRSRREDESGGCEGATLAREVRATGRASVDMKGSMNPGVLVFKRLKTTMTGPKKQRRRCKVPTRHEGPLAVSAKKIPFTLVRDTKTIL